MTDAIITPKEVLAETFVRPIFAMYSLRNPGPLAMQLVLTAFYENLGEFDQPTLARACRIILREHNDAFLPPLAQCIEICIRARCELAGEDYIDANTRAMRAKQLADYRRRIEVIAGRAQ